MRAACSHVQQPGTCNSSDPVFDTFHWLSKWVEPKELISMFLIQWTWQEEATIPWFSQISLGIVKSRTSPSCRGKQRISKDVMDCEVPDSQGILAHAGTAPRPHSFVALREECQGSQEHQSQMWSCQRAHLGLQSLLPPSCLWWIRQVGLPT